LLLNCTGIKLRETYVALMKGSIKLTETYVALMTGSINGYKNTPVRRPSIRQDIKFRRRPALLQQVVTELRRLRYVSTQRSGQLFIKGRLEFIRTQTTWVGNKEPKLILRSCPLKYNSGYQGHRPKGILKYTTLCPLKCWDDGRRIPNQLIAIRYEVPIAFDDIEILYLKWHC
jgi:hypothetical protein